VDGVTGWARRRSIGPVEDLERIDPQEFVQVGADDRPAAVHGLAGDHQVMLADPDAAAAQAAADLGGGEAVGIGPVDDLEIVEQALGAGGLDLRPLADQGAVAQLVGGDGAGHQLVAALDRLVVALADLRASAVDQVDHHIGVEAEDQSNASSLTMGWPE